MADRSIVRALWETWKTVRRRGSVRPIRMDRSELEAQLLHVGPFLDGPNKRYPFDWRSTFPDAVALLLRCIDGRHWVNVTSAPSRMIRHHEAGERVLGLVSAAASESLRVALGHYPDCGASVCDRCVTSTPPSQP